MSNDGDRGEATTKAFWNIERNAGVAGPWGSEREVPAYLSSRVRATSTAVILKGMVSMALRAALAIASVHAASAFALGPLQSLGLRALGRSTARAWQMKAPSRYCCGIRPALAAGQAEREFIRTKLS